MLFTFGLTVFAWIFFRADSVKHAFNYISSILTKSIFKLPEIRPKYIFVLLLIFIITEWFGREQQYAIAQLGKKWKWQFRYLLYFTIITLLFWFGGNKEQFIYFQF